MIWEGVGAVLVAYQLVAVAKKGARISQRWSTRVLVSGFCLGLLLHFWEEVRA